MDEQLQPSAVTSSPSEQFEQLAISANRRGEPVRLRINLELYDPDAGRYRFWKETSERVVLDAMRNPQVGNQFRQALTLFLDALITVGPSITMNALTGLVGAAQKPQRSPVGLEHETEAQR